MNKIVIVTGASSGLGLSLAKKFVEAKNIVVGISKTKKNWPAATKTIGEKDRFTLYQCDLTSEAKVKTLIGKIKKKFKCIDVLVNSAGYAKGLTTVDKTTLGDFQKHVADNLQTAFLMSKHVIPYMRKQKEGVILNVASMAGKRAVPKLFSYSASKFGMVALSQAIAKENEDAGIKCVSICPGGVNTKMRAQLFGKADAQKQQSPDFVAGLVYQVSADKIDVESGGDIVIRHNEITEINPCPAP